VLFLHGFPSSSHLWHGVVRQMPAGHRLIVLDQLGYGRSDRPGSSDLSVAGHAARALAVLDTLNVPSACVVGHDLGGAVAMWLAVRAPERVTRLALVSSVGFDGWPRRRTRVARALIPLVRQLPAPLLAGEAYASLLRGFSDRDMGRHALDQFLRPFAQPAGRDALLAHLAAQRPDETVTLPLDGIRAPTVVMHGADDPFVPAAVARRLHAAIPGATLDLVPHARHFLPLDTPDHVAAAMAAVLAR